MNRPSVDGCRAAVSLTGDPADASGKVETAIDISKDLDTPISASQNDSKPGKEHQGMSVTFQDVVYTVRHHNDRSQRITILKGISGAFSPGEMAATMGPSGSGKSTMLDLLAGRKTTGETTGAIMFAGTRPTQAFLRRYTGYVEQFDTLLAELTVAEMLMYTAELKCPLAERKAAKRERVAALLEELALRECAHTVIGDATSRGISGGQAKRTNIGIALITRPRVLFLDEPTSGLDSYTAHEVMSVVKLLALRGMTICATIHCPPPHTFVLFDRLLVLQRGAPVYFGLNGEAALSYFYNNFDKVRQKGDAENLAEWIVHLTTDADRQGSDRFVVGYARSSLQESNDEDVQHLVQVESTNASKATLNALGTRKATVTPMWKGLTVMLAYRTRNNYCCGMYLFGRLFDKTIFTILTFTYYWHVGQDLSSRNAPNIAGLLFMWAILPAYGAGPYLPAIVMERPVYLREMSDGLYTPFTYLLYKIIEEMLMAVAMSVAFTLPVFYCCKMQGSFFIVWLVWLISLADGIAFAYATAAWSPTLDIANAILLTLPTALLFAAGYMLRIADIPRYWIWMSYINWLWYSWGSLMVNQFKGSSLTAYGTDQTVLEYYSLDRTDAWAFLGYASLFFLMFCIIAWAGLVFARIHVKR